MAEPPNPIARSGQGRFLRLSDLTSAELVELARSADVDAPAAWEQLVTRYERLVWKVVRCFGLSREASWEAFQSTWLRTIEKLDTVSDPERFSGWLATVARNEALSVIRGRQREVPAEDMVEITDAGPPPEEGLHRQELLDAVRQGFGCLGQPCQDLLRMLTIDPPLSYREIEEVLHMRHGSIGPTRRRCLDKLRQTPALMAYLAPESTTERGPT